MKNITITLDEATAAWVRVAAAEADKSVSRYIADLLGRQRRDAHEYAEAMRRYLERKPARIRAAGSVLPTRESLHERTDLR